MQKFNFGRSYLPSDSHANTVISDCFAYPSDGVLKVLKKKCGYIFKGGLVNISEERKCILVHDRLGPEGQNIYDSLDWGENEDVNNYELIWTKLEGALSAECHETPRSFKEIPGTSSET